MRIVTTLLLSMMIVAGFAGRKSELAIGYTINKDTVDGSVDPGKCKISGVALYEGNPVPKALVYGEHTRSVRTDEEGKFVITLDTNEHYLVVSMGNEREGFIEYYQFKGGHSIDCEVYIRDWDDMMIVDKPVIYLYSPEEIKANVELKTELKLSFTYPVIEETGWDVTVGTDGVRMSDGRTYPYLFWEAEAYDLEYAKEEEVVLGSLVRTDTIISYLENTLTDIGLNSTEKTDFITYWGPRMIQYEYVLTQFSVNEYLLNLAELNITPVPDAQQRVFMLFTGFEDMPDIEVVPQNFRQNKFERKGFTVLEWGGTEISHKHLMKKI